LSSAASQLFAINFFIAVLYNFSLFDLLLTQKPQSHKGTKAFKDIMQEKGSKQTC